MAEDQTIKFILEAVDNASATFSKAASNFSESSGKILEDTKGLQVELAAIGLAAAGFLTLSAKAYADEEQAITNTARVVSTMGGDYASAREQISAFTSELEKQGYETEDTTQAITLLMTKGGRDLPTAMSEAADFMAAAQARGMSLQRAIAALNKEEGAGKLDIEGANKARMETLTTNERLEIVTIRFGNVMERIGQKLIPIAEWLLNIATGLLDWFDKLDPVFQDIIIVLTIVGAAIAAIVGAIASIALAVAPVISALASFGITWGTVSAAIGSVISAIAGVVAVIIGFISGAAEILIVIAAIIAIVALLYTAWNENWLGIQQVFAQLMNGFNIIFTFMGDTINSFVVGMGDLFNNLYMTITQTLQQLIDSTAAQVAGWTAGMFAAITKFATDGFNAIKSFVTNVTSAFTTLVSDAIKWGSDLVSNILKGIQDKASEIAKSAASAAKGAAKALLGGATGLVATGVAPLAAGGIITQPTLAVLGEGGENEYVIPESKMRDWIGGRGNISITLNVSGASDPERVAQMASEIIIREINSSNSDVMTSSKV